MIWIQNQLVGAFEGQEVTLECHSEAYPKSINYWTGDRGDIIAQGKSSSSSFPSLSISPPITFQLIFYFPSLSIKIYG